MRDDVVYVVGLEFMKYRHSHRSVGEHGEERYRPVGAVAPAQGYPVARFQAGVAEEQVEFGDLAGNVAVLIARSVEVRQCRIYPVFLY